MKRYIFYLLVTAFSFTFASAALAQEKQEITQSDYNNRSVEMADNFRGEGKIYVVVAVMLCLLGVLVFYLVRMDIKLSKMEERIEEHISAKGKN